MVPTYLEKNMCGITGIFYFDGQSPSQEQITLMNDSISHRGPDGSGYFLDGGIALGHRRLAIVDLSSAGKQPMKTVDSRYVISYNGEVYNFQDLRLELEMRGYQFHSKTDTEVILNAFCEWGSACVHKFNGMFAFAIWDQKLRRLFLARDRYGIKPLYYYLNDKSLVFASENKAIIASGIYTPSLDIEGLVEYLTFQNMLSDKTLLDDVRMLMPGHYMFIDEKGKTDINQYWDFDFFNSLNLKEDEAIEETDRLFRQAVQRQLVSDVPVNAYLSGGIDSGAITRIASEHLSNMKTFTVGFDLSSASKNELTFDERKKAEYLSYMAGTEHYEMVLKARDMERCMTDYVKHLEEPRVGQSYPNYYAAKLASKFGKVVLAGTGGDELFGGYPWRYFYTNQVVSGSEFMSSYYPKWQRLFDHTKINELLKPIASDLSQINPRDTFYAVFNKFNLNTKKLTPEECLNLSFYFEAKTFLHGLLVVDDKLNMAHGLEARVPFLDNDLVDFALKVPYGLKLSWPKLNKSMTTANEGKVILRKTLSRYLDKNITEGKKQGFSSPDASWFKQESQIFVQKELSDLPQILDSQTAKDILDEHLSSIKNNRLAIWSLVYLRNYIRNFNIAADIKKMRMAS